MILIIHIFIALLAFVTIGASLYGVEAWAKDKIKPILRLNHFLHALLAGSGLLLVIESNAGIVKSCVLYGAYVGLLMTLHLRVAHSATSSWQE